MAKFEGLGLLHRGPGDSLITFEPQSRRVQRWTPDGDVIDLKPLVPPAGRLNGWVRGAFDDGSLLVATERSDFSGNGIVVPAEVALFRAAGAAGAWDSLQVFAGVPKLRHHARADLLYGSPLFAAAPSFHQRRGSLAFAAGDRFEIEIRSSAGRLQRILRRAAVPRVVTDAEFERAIAAAVESLDSDRREAMTERYRQASRNRVRPAISGVWVAGDGRVWAFFGDPSIGERVAASVFDTLGRWQADVRLPARLDVNQIDEDGILTTFKDDDGFGRIRFYRFVSAGLGQAR